MGGGAGVAAGQAEPWLGWSEHRWEETGCPHPALSSDEATDNNSVLSVSTGKKKGSLALQIRILQAASKRDSTKKWLGQ